MGNERSRISFQEKQEQTELLMEQNTEIAKRLSREFAGNKRKHGTVIREMGKNMFAHIKQKNAGANGQNRMKQVEIEGVTYDIIDFISEGGFGSVYKAQAQNKNRVVAIKIMKNAPNIQEEIQNEVRFLNLTRKITLDNHPVIYYYGCQFAKENIHIAMELASCDLTAFWFTQVAESAPENKFLVGITLIVYVLRALTFLENLNIIHGDIKPQNLVIVPDKECFHVKLIDFGTVEKMDTSRAQITVDATKAHTIFFASPEFLKRDSNNIMARHLHKKSDAWAAGVLFYILFFERFPWKDQFEYDNFCNDPNSRDIFVPRKGGYKSIIELLLKKNPEQRSSAKATLKQMKGHPALRDLIDSLHESFSPVDDVCRMRVPDEVLNELAKLARPGHYARASKLFISRTSSGSRRPCRYGRDCYRHDNPHREDFAHPGDTDYHPTRDASNGQPDKPLCRYGSDCYRSDREHLNKYAHPNGASTNPIGAIRREHSTKTPCRYGASCYNTSMDHRSEFAHPHDMGHGRGEKTPCRYGVNCKKKADHNHMAKFGHQ